MFARGVRVPRSRELPLRRGWGAVLGAESSVFAAKLSEQAGAPGITGEASAHRRRAGASCWGIREQGHGMIALSPLSAESGASPGVDVPLPRTSQSRVEPAGSLPHAAPYPHRGALGHVQTPLMRALSCCEMFVGNE